MARANRPCFNRLSASRERMFSSLRPLGQSLSKALRGIAFVLAVIAAPLHAERVRDLAPTRACGPTS